MNDRMNDELESELRQALRPVAAPENFSGRVAAAVGKKRASRRSLMPVAWWLSAGIAASVVIGFGLERRLQEQRELAAGLQARHQVIEALRVTHAKLDLAYQNVMTQSEAAGTP